MGNPFDTSAKMLQSMGDASAAVQEVTDRLGEFVEPLKFFGASLAFTGADLVLHQIFDPTKGEKTPKEYYRNKALFSVPLFLGGRLLTDAIGGPPLARAAVVATLVNSVLQLRYLYKYSPSFNLAVFLIHEVLLIPISFLIIGPPELL